MFSNIHIGKYYPAKSFLHSLNSATKTTSTMLFLITIIFVNNIYMILGISLFSFFIIYLSGVPTLFYLRGLWRLKILFILIIVFNIIIYGTNIVPIIAIILKIFNIVIYTSVLTFTTSPSELTYDLERTFRPFNKIMPVKELSLVITLAIRFIPSVLETASKIMKSQASRGIDFKYSKINGKIKALSSLLIPMFILSFKRADNLSDAMEVKLYNYSNNRTNYRMNKWRLRDTFIVLFYSLILVVFIVSEVVFL